MTTLSSVFSPDLTLLDSICIGSGRFLRAVLVPALVSADYHPCIIQTRGKSFLEFSCETNKFSYEVDTVHYDGKVETTAIPYWGAGTLGTPEGKKDVLDLLASKKLGTSASKPFLLGIGVTEAGLSSASTKAMKDLYDILKCLSKRNEFQKTKICVINTDNVSQNGTLMQEFMNELASGDEVMETFCSHFVVFHNTMVDRITSHRPESEMIPRAEPTPSKALVIEDLESILQPIFGSLRKSHGVVIRSSKGQLDADIALKLRVANGTHTAAAHTMALTGLVMTDVLSSDSEQSKLLLNYLDSLVANQIVPGVEATADFSATKAETQAVYDDWRRRLIHAHFGLSTFFITQNGAAKGGIRIGPTIRDLIQSSSDIQCSTVFSLSALLRFLTHTGTKAKEANLYVGWFDPEKHEESKTIPYADGLEYNISEGWYYFRCGCTVRINGEETPLPMALHNIGLKQQPIAYESVIESYLCQSDGGNLGKVSDTSAFTILVRAVATLYARMMAGDALMDILGSLDMEASCESLVDVPYNCTIEAFDASRPLHYQKASIPDDSLLLEAPLVKDTIESAHRGVNPKLLSAGDGVVAFADAGLLARLCSRFPKVRFLATFLSRANQHEACVLASKFRNLHLYGCWWFCNNPSIIEEITKMRVEMLGTAFTAQHSDARVLDQLLYKWPHSRAVLAQVITNEYKKLIQTGGWTPTRREIRRDVGRWFGGSYEEFLSKSLA